MDLVNWNSRRSDKGADEDADTKNMPPTGFGGLSNRPFARKPVIAAVNGYALGGGTEMLMACNIVVATKRSKLGLPEGNAGILFSLFLRLSLFLVSQ